MSTTEDEPQQAEEDQDQPRSQKSADSKRPGGATRKQTSRARASREKPVPDRPRSSAPRSSASRSSASRRDSDSKDDAGDDRRGTGDGSATRAARQAAEVLAMLTGRTPEAVTGIERHDDGWRVQLEVVETHKIPETADLMALYDVELDSSGEFTGHRRVRRYSRGQGGEG